eukprot:SAG22_NODE_2439_length_2574_cov_2.044848_2_plen_31_part_01
MRSCTTHQTLATGGWDGALRLWDCTDWTKGG